MRETDTLHASVMHRIILTKTDDAGVQQLVDYDGLHGEKHTEVYRSVPHGVISVPGAGAEGVVGALGTRDVPVVFGAEHPDKRPKGLPVWAGGFYDGSGLLVYGDGQGNVFVKKAKSLDAEVEGDAKVKVGGTMTLEVGKLVIKGDIEHTGNMTTSGVHTDANGVHG